MVGESVRGAGKTLANDLNVRQLNGIGMYHFPYGTPYILHVHILIR